MSDKYLKAIAETLEGIHNQLKILNETNPTPKKESVKKESKKPKHLDPKDFI